MDENDATCNSEENTAFYIGSREDSETIVLNEDEEQNIISDFEQTTDLDFAVRENYQPTTWELFEYDENQYTTLKFDENNDLECIVREEPIEVEEGEDINAILDCEGNTLLHRAAIQEDENTVLELLQKGADANKKNTKGNTAVHEAVIEGKLKILKLLFENGGDINLTGQNGLLPLQMAPDSKNHKCLDAILACNPDINKKDDHGNTTLIHYANEHYNKTTDILKLLECGSDPNITNNLGWNCLHIIAADWQLSKGNLVRTLIDYGIDINAELPGIKITPLHLACSNFKNEYLVHILLQNDAMFTKNWKKMKPFDIVSWCNLSRICAHGVLREHHCKELRRITHLTEVSELLFTRVFKRCKRELDIIKETKIEGFTLTYYEFLFCSREESCKLSLKKQFRVEIAKSVQYFSVYSDFLLDKLYQGIQLRRANINVCYFLSGIFKIPFVCCEEIVRYFSTDELMFLQRRLEIS